jgi:hypothetical protein
LRFLTISLMPYMLNLSLVEENQQTEQINIDSNETSIRSRAVLLVGALLLILNIVIWLLLAKRPDYSSSISIIGLGLFTLLLIGLLVNKSTRAIYIGATALIILLAVGASYGYLSNYRHQNLLRQNIIAQTQTSISGYAGDKLISGSELSTTTQELKNTEANELSKLNKKNSLLPLATCYLLAILSVIYVTKIKQDPQTNELQPLDEQVYDQPS